ncbi:tripartite motif-containing protein 2-like [Branchiostoma lanceolatum]|uniref:tripartite motif-containing protein 2-like n=1 Tax=Branchiostoma lanceolatum TaxID=7740 RepID=UPI00345353AB
MAYNALNSAITEEFLVCQICLDNFKQPKVLPCLHTFCQPCLERLLATQPLGKLSCPTCRRDVPLPQNGVRGLTSNFLIGKLHDILQQQPGAKGETSQSRADGVPCTACDRGNPAEFYCVECADYLCQSCEHTHRGLKATRSHKVVTSQDLESGQFAAELGARETSKCEDHNELNKFYCDTCHRVICPHCVITAHKHHQYVEIEKAAERERGKIKAKLSTVKNTAGLHEKWIGELQSVKDDWALQVQRTEEQFEKQAEAVQKAKTEKISQLRAMNAVRDKQMKAAMEAVEMDLASAKSCIQFTDSVLQYGSPAEVMSVAGELTAQIEQTADQKILERAELTKGFVNLTFDPPACASEEDISNLIGWIKQTTLSVTSTQLPVRTNVGKMATCSWIPKLLKTVGERGTRDGQFNYPTALSVTSDGYIVVADRDNKRIQFLDKDGTYKRKVGLKFKPLCLEVNRWKNDEVLVTGDGHKIRVLGKRGRESRVIQLLTGVEEKDKTTQGIAVDGFGRIIVTIGYQVFVLSPSGDVILKFGCKGQGQQQLSSSLRIAVNESNQIIISDFGNDSLKIFDPTGRHLFTCGSHGFGPGQLYGPYCVITDRDDNIVVAEWYNQRVTLFSRDGTFIRQVLTREEHGVNFPRGLTLTHDGDGPLAICDEHSVKIFKL